MLCVDELKELLSPRRYAAVECRYARGMSQSQIADSLGISQRRVRYLFSEAKRQLVKHGIELPEMTNQHPGRHRVFKASEIIDRESGEPLDLDRIEAA